MNANAADLKMLMRAAGVTRDQAAGLLYVKIDTVHQWLKPETSRNANPCPRWAVELFAYKTGQKVPEMPADAAKPQPEPIDPGKGQP